MRFAHPEYIHLIWLTIGVVAFLFWRRLAKERQRALFADTATFDKLSPSLDRRAAQRRIILIGLVLLLSVVALMRPQWGFQWREIKREGLDILIALDTSKSMLTEDVKPNRLERAKLGVLDLIKKLHGDRIGLVAFSGDGFLVCPLTIDYNGFVLTLNDVNVDTIPQGGTALSAAIEQAMKAYEKSTGKYKNLIIITDGEDLEGSVEQRSEDARKKGITIHCVGIGTPDGELIRVKNAQGDHEFLKDASGNFVKSRLNESLLQKLAVDTGGMYVRATGAELGLDMIYEQRLAHLERSELKSKMEKQYHERFQLPLALAFILLCIETVMSDRKKL